MRNEARKQMVELAKANQDHDPVALAIADATEGDFVSPRYLKENLEGQGFEVKETPRKVLTRVEVLKDGAQVMYGESGDAGDALLQAALAHLRALPVADKATA